jgi:hypothetical protein
MSDAARKYADVVDKYIAGAATFNLDMLKEATTPDFRAWYNTTRMDRRALNVEELFYELLMSEKESGFSVSVRDKRRYIAGNTLIQQDIAKVTRGDESFEFARCHVFMFEGDKIHRKWEYYDSGSTRNWAVDPSPLVVPE